MKPIRGWRDAAFRLSVVLWFALMIGGVCKVGQMLLHAFLASHGCGCER